MSLYEKQRICRKNVRSLNKSQSKNFKKLKTETIDDRINYYGELYRNIENEKTACMDDIKGEIMRLLSFF